MGRAQIVSNRVVEILFQMQKLKRKQIEKIRMKVSFIKYVCFENLILNFLEQLLAIPEFAHLGPIFKSSLPVHLTENKVEYVVRCIKHAF